MSGNPDNDCSEWDGKFISLGFPHAIRVGVCHVFDFADRIAGDDDDEEGMFLDDGVSVEQGEEPLSSPTLSDLSRTPSVPGGFVASLAVRGGREGGEVLVPTGRRAALLERRRDEEFRRRELEREDAFSRWTEGL